LAPLIFSKRLGNSSAVATLEEMILLTGFPSFPGYEHNPSEALALELGGILLPLEKELLLNPIRAELDQLRPSGLLLTGFAPSRAQICVESRALNIWKEPSRNYQPEAEAIRERGPKQLATGLDVEAIVTALTGLGIPARGSGAPGSYLCNHAYYQALSELSLPTLLVHLPAFSQIPLEIQRQAIYEVIQRMKRPGPASE